MRSFIAWADRGKTAWPYYFGTIALVGLGYVSGQMPLLVVMNIMPVNDPERLRQFEEQLDFELIGMDPVFGVSLMMLTYVGALIALWIGLNWIHKRPLSTLIGEWGSTLWKKSLWALGIWILLSTVSEAALYLIEPDNYRYTGMRGHWWSMMGLTLVLIPVQTSFEELFFRGYILQGLAQAVRSPWVGALGSSILFALMHSFNPEIQQFGYGSMMGYYFIAGLFLATVTIYSNSLSLALGLHAGTNMFSAAIAGYEGGVFKLPSLFLVNEVYVPLMIGVLVLMGAIFIFLARRKYKWGIVPYGTGNETNFKDLNQT